MESSILSTLYQHEQHHCRCTGAPEILGYNHTCSYCCTAMISINNARLHNNCRLHRSLYFCQLCPCSMQRRRARHCHILSSCLLPIMCYQGNSCPPFSSVSSALRFSAVFHYPRSFSATISAYQACPRKFHAVSTSLHLMSGGWGGAVHGHGLL